MAMMAHGWPRKAPKSEESSGNELEGGPQICKLQRAFGSKEGRAVVGRVQSENWVLVEWKREWLAMPAIWAHKAIAQAKVMNKEAAVLLTS
eukprot:1159302-Pelagomonas_calceolata.AAC.14